jgi:antirestriction protein ArdC
MSFQSEIRSNITSQIVTEIQDGNLPPWRIPWRPQPNSGFPTNVVSERAYTGVNPLILMLARQKMGFHSKWWATFRQWKELGGTVMRRPDHIKPGQWGTQIVFCKPVKRTRFDKNGEEIEESFRLLRGYVVFNLDQVVGPFDHLRATPDGHLASNEVEARFERAEQVIEATNADIRFGGDRACYSFDGDFIRIPNRDQFSLPEYYETIFHELCHWSEHPTRLAWSRQDQENTYAMGELIAEIGGCYLAGELGLPISENLENHAAYLRHWLQAMRNDSSFIFKAAAQASRAADYILSFSKTPSELQAI